MVALDEGEDIAAGTADEAVEDLFGFFVNMLLMGGPLYLLYEAGIIILVIMRIP